LMVDSPPAFVGLRRGEPLNSQLSNVLLIHGEQDAVFPLSEAQRVAACLQTNGVPVELKVLPGQGHGLGGNHLLVFRVIGEQCLRRLNGPEALGRYRSILSSGPGQAVVVLVDARLALGCRVSLVPPQPRLSGRDAWKRTAETR
jgi:acetyl esterase/lipase